MAKKMSGLGRGLGSLFGDAGVDLAVLNPAEISLEPAAYEAGDEGSNAGESKGLGENEAASSGRKTPGTAGKTAKKTSGPSENVVFIALSDIKPNSAQPRKVFDKEALEDLASSIKEHGVIQPVLLRPAASGYELVAGERRWRAARMAGLRQIPAIVRELTDRQNMFYALIENMQREDLNSIEEAQGMEEMMLSFGLTQDETAKAVGKSRSYVANALRLLKLPSEVQQMVMEGSLSSGHARAIAGLAEKDQLDAAKKAAEGGWSVRQVESFSQEKKRPGKKRKARAKAKDEDIAAAEQQMCEALGTKVRINGNEKKGRLELEYYSRGELERLIEILLGKFGE